MKNIALPNWREWLLSLVSILLCFVILEMAYRVNVYLKQPKWFEPPSIPEDYYFGAYDVSHWEFDRDFGYVYPPNRKINLTSIANGRVVSCSQMDTINPMGNIGPIEGDYQKAELKIAVFGDSFSAFHVKNQTWPLRLQRLLIQSTGKDVHVLNFGRDGYGLLQMVDLAHAKVAEFKPDIVIFAFITNDLQRARLWRTVIPWEGGQRVVTTDLPTDKPPPGHMVDTMLIDKRAEHEWCSRRQQDGQSDEIVESFVQRYKTNRFEGFVDGPYHQASLFDLDGSYLYGRLRYLDARAHLRVKGIAAGLPQFDLDSYEDDPVFVKKVAELRQMNVPILLVHLPLSTELHSSRWLGNSAFDHPLLDSLETVFGTETLRVSDYLAAPVPDPSKMNVIPNDAHPSLYGQEVYARAVEKMLFENGLIKPKAAKQPD